LPEEKVVSEALREIAEALGYEKVIRMILPKDRRAHEILRRILRDFEEDTSNKDSFYEEINSLSHNGNG